jgi:pantoate--beta-alanine ligase
MSSSPAVINNLAAMLDYVNIIPTFCNMGFVPTMGCLHDGHLSLIERSIRENENTIVSVFVNPTQFNENEDYNSYPRDIEKDIAVLSGLKVDAIFTPERSEMFPNDFVSWVEVEKYSNMYCGANRPGHFKGVATVICKLLNIIRPNFLYLGEKDFQQLFILEKLLDDLNYRTQVVRCESIRETDGLAMSSRNVGLSYEQRQNATSIYKSLMLAKDLVSKGESDIEPIKAKMTKMIYESGGELDYIEFVNEYTLEVEKLITPCTRVLLAVKYGKTRLIDNYKLK